MSLAVVCAAELRRVEYGRLFLVSLPQERPPSDVEIADAQRSARSYRYPAVAVVLCLGVVVGWLGPSAFSWPRSRVFHAVLAAFAVAALADLLTTVRFFHTHGIEYELHPAIRLFGYAYGRTTGPVLGKTVQAAGVLGVASLLDQRRATWLLAAVTVVYLGAAGYNAFNSL